MPLILNIETATDVCSVCLSRDGLVLALREMAPTLDHAAQITLMIEACFQEVGLPLAALDAVAVSDGPGSYTSLRIGLAAAKGICYALEKPLIALSTLQSIALAAQKQSPDADIYAVMIDARRMEVYLQVFDSNNQPLADAEACILEATLFESQLHEGFTIVCAGNGSPKAQSLLTAPRISFANTVCSATHLVPLAEAAFYKNAFADIAYHAPFYLKPPNITTPKKGL